MAKTKTINKLEATPAGNPKSPRQRKVEFDKRHLNRGKADPTRPERWAVMVYLTKEAKATLAATRRNNFLGGSGPSTNSEIVEDLLLSPTTKRDVGEVKGEGRHPPRRKLRGAKLESAAALLAKLEDPQLEDADVLLNVHEAFRRRWAQRMAPEVMSLMRNGATEESLRWLFFDAIDDYMNDLIDCAGPNWRAPLTSAEEEVLAWIKFQLGLATTR